MADVDTLLIHVGLPNDATVYQKSTALHVSCVIGCTVNNII